MTYLLPTYRRFSRWSDRVKRVDTPLFPGYVFVHVSEAERIALLRTFGVVSLVSCGGRPVPLSNLDMEALRACAANPEQVEPHPYLQVGRRVRVTHGPFQGWEGILVEKKTRPAW